MKFENILWIFFSKSQKKNLFIERLLISLFFFTSICFVLLHNFYDFFSFVYKLYYYIFEEKENNQFVSKLKNHKSHL